MALDNLLSFGPRYIRPSPSIILAMSASDVLYLILLLFMFWATAAISRRIWHILQAYECTAIKERARQRRRHLKQISFWIIGWVISSFALVLGFGFALFVLLCWSLNDVLGVMLLLLAVRLVPDWKVIACFLRQCRHQHAYDAEPDNDINQVQTSHLNDVGKAETEGSPSP